MGFAAVAGHLVIAVAVLGAGVVLAGALTNSYSSQVDARDQAFDRNWKALGEEIDLRSDGYATEKDRTYANFTNNGSEEIPTGDVDVLVDGSHVDTDDLARFRVRDHASSDVWMPGEVLEVMTEGRGDVNVTVVGPYGLSEHRRT